jgi:hypothetical protein
MKFSRLAYSTLIGAIVMFSLSYVWHGVILNDFKFIQYDRNIFLGLLTVVYLFISGGISFVLLLYKPEESKLLKHFSIGLIVGFIINLIIFVLGLSLAGKGLANNVINFAWQMIEQGLGAFFISIFIGIAHRRDKILSFADAIDD